MISKYNLPLTDNRDGIIYQTVQIGTQIWMSENLRYNHPTWSGIVDANYLSNYGRVYRWVEASTDACPTGWHVPNDNEWQILETFLGMNNSELNTFTWRGTIEGGKLKSLSSLWVPPNISATDEFGFHALPGGLYLGSGNWSFITTDAFFWTSSAYDTDNGIVRELQNSSGKIKRAYYHKTNNAVSIRCIKD